MNHTKTLLVVGAGLFQTYCIKEAKRLGVRVVSIDKDTHAIGFQYCDGHMIASTKNHDACVFAARKLHEQHTIDGVMTCGTDAAFTVACIASDLRLPGIPPKTAYNVTHKGLMREVLKRQGVPVPEFDCAETIDQALHIFDRLQKPFVIKPVDSMGARGVKRIDSKKALIQFMNESLKHSVSKKIILEEYMQGPEFSVETLVHQGQVHLISIADRHISGLPYFIERGHTLPSRFPKKVLDELFAMAKRGISAMDIHWGPVKFDMKYTKKGARIGEMTARLSGGFHSQLTEGLAQGTNSIKAVIDMSLNNPLDMTDITPKYHRCALERSIYPKPGKVVSVRELQKVRDMEHVEEVHLNIREGDIQYPVISNLGKAGHIIVKGENRRKAIQTVNLALKTLKITTK